VVEKTALAEAEVEYEDYTSDMVWVKFSGRPSRIRIRQGRFRRDRTGRERCEHRDLDHHALDAAGQPRHQLFRRRFLTALSDHGLAAGQIGRKPGIS